MKSVANLVRTLVRAASVVSLVATTACGDNGSGPVESVARTSEPLDLNSLNVLTSRYDNLRSGANLSETVLTQANVNTFQFGKVLQLPVDDEVYAQVLYASGVTIGGVNHHVIYVATVNNSVYAFDADSGGAPLWMKNYNGSGSPPNHTQVGVGGFCGGGYNDFVGNIGIVGTPVIDGNTGRMYFVTRHVVGTTFSQILRAIDVTTGNDVVTAKTIAATVPGNGDGSSGGNVSFDPKMHNQRSALALAGGAVYIGWAGHCDFRPYHGWVMAYDASTLNQIGAFNATPNGMQAGIWMSGSGPIVDTTGVYFNTGNGAGDLGGSTPGFGESAVKFSLGNVNVTTSFTAGDWSTLNGADNDLGVSGMAAVPGTSFILTGSKTGKGYLLNSSNLGGLNSGDSQIPQFFQAADLTARPSALSARLSVQHVDAKVQHSRRARRLDSAAARDAGGLHGGLRTWVDFGNRDSLGDGADVGRREPPDRGWHSAGIQRGDVGSPLGQQQHHEHDGLAGEIQSTAGGQGQRLRGLVRKRGARVVERGVGLSQHLDHRSPLGRNRLADSGADRGRKVRHGGRERRLLRYDGRQHRGSVRAGVSYGRRRYSGDRGRRRRFQRGVDRRGRVAQVHGQCSDSAGLHSELAARQHHRR